MPKLTRATKRYVFHTFEYSIAPNGNPQMAVPGRGSLEFTPHDLRDHIATCELLLAAAEAAEKVSLEELERRIAKLERSAWRAQFLDNGEVRFERVPQ